MLGGKDSGIESIQHPWKRYGFAHVFKATDPGDSALDAHAESAVGDTAEFAQVQVPLECLFRQTMLMNALEQKLVRRHALRASDDFSVPFGSEHIDAQRELGTLGIRFHVEGLHLGGIAMHHYRLVELRGQIRLVGRAEISAPFEV